MKKFSAISVISLITFSFIALFATLLYNIVKYTVTKDSFGKLDSFDIVFVENNVTKGKNKANSTMTITGSQDIIEEQCPNFLEFLTAEHPSDDEFGVISTYIFYAEQRFSRKEIARFSVKTNILADVARKEFAQNGLVLFPIPNFRVNLRKATQNNTTLLFLTGRGDNFIETVEYSGHSTTLTLFCEIEHRLCQYDDLKKPIVTAKTPFYKTSLFLSAYP